MKTMWTYLPEYIQYLWCYVQLAWAVYVGPFIKPKRVSPSDTEED